MPRWRPVTGYGGAYEVSDEGDVRSWLPWKGQPTPRTLKATPDDKGYPRVNLPRDGKQCHVRVHALVTAEFIGPRPEGREVRHLDGDRLNGSLGNLDYGTHAENMADRLAHGNDRNAAKQSCSEGHSYDTENTYVSTSGGRHCRACRRANTQAYRARLKETISA